MLAKPFARNRNDQDRLVIVALDGFEGHVRAQFNPAQVQVDKSVTWDAKESHAALPYQHFQSSAPRTMTLELFFDCFEVKNATLEDDLDTLNRMAVAPDPGSRLDEDRRPPLLEVMNGPIRGFRCVLESVAVKVTMFDREMQPVRATATVKLKEIPRGAKPSPKNPVSVPRRNFQEDNPEEEARIKPELALKFRRLSTAS